MKTNRSYLTRLGLPAAGLLMAGASFAGTLQQGLVIHLPFDGNLTDTVGNISPIPQGGSGPVDGGKIGSGALKFWSYKNAGEVPEGESQFNYLTLSGESDPNSVLDFGADGDLASQSDFSVSFWVKVGAWTGDPSFFSNKDWTDGGKQGYVIAGAGDGHFQWNYKESNNGRVDHDGPSHVIDGGAWHHIVWTVKRSGNASFYVDGGLVDTRPVAKIDAATGEWLPGSLNAFDVNIGQDGRGTYTDGGGVGIQDSYMDDFGLWRRALNAGEVGRIYSSALKGINLADVPDPTTPALTRLLPSNGAVNSSPAGTLDAAVQDAGTALNTASVKLFLDDKAVTPVVTAGDPGTHVISFSPATIFASGSTHTYRLEYSDNGAPVVTKKETVQFTVGTYDNLILGAPVYLETFDEVAEVLDAQGQLPDGWTVQNFTSGAKGVFNLNDSGSDSYLDWVIISSNRLAQVFDQRRLNSPRWAVVNGKVISSLAVGNILYAESDNRGGNQYQIVYSKDYDLTGKSNIYLGWNSLYEQNQDSFGGVEYSIDGGTTWEPVIYMIDTPDIVKDVDGNVDPVATLTNPVGDAAKYTRPDDGSTTDGHWGSFMGVAEDRYSELTPYISGRVNDDTTESKRYELHRLPLADNQAKVRLRFAQAGTGSWYFGIDEVALYSLTPATVTISTTAGKTTVAFDGGKLQSAPSLSGPWTDVAGAASPYEVTGSEKATFFRAVKGS